MQWFVAEFKFPEPGAAVFSLQEHTANGGDSAAGSRACCGVTFRLNALKLHIPNGRYMEIEQYHRVVRQKSRDRPLEIWR